MQYFTINLQINISIQYVATTIKIINSRFECPNNGAPICAGPGPASASGEVFIFESSCHLDVYNMEYPKRRKNNINYI